MNSAGYQSLPIPPVGPGKWAKIVWYLAETIATGLAYQAFDYGVQIDPTQASTTAEGASEWRKLQVRWLDTVSLEAADDQLFTLDVVNFTNGAVDSSWTDADHDRVGFHVGNFLAAIAPYVASRYSSSEVLFYRAAFNPYGAVRPDGKPAGAFALSGPPVFNHPAAVAGASTATIGAQLCSTITEETPLRKHWGRIYTPTIGASQYDVNGRLKGSCAGSLAIAYDALLTALHSEDFWLVVPTQTSNGMPARTLQAVTGTRVDDVPDVIRRRRLKHWQYQSVIAAPSARTLPATPK